LSIDNSLGNPIHATTTSVNEKSLKSIGLLCVPLKIQKLDLPQLYCISKLHTCPYKQQYIAGSAKCSMPPLSESLAYILSAVKTGLHSYCETSYSSGDVNQMWILKNSKNVLEYK